MDLPVVVSHRTAWLLHHASGFLERRCAQLKAMSTSHTHDPDAPLLSAQELALARKPLMPAQTASPSRATALMPREIARYVRSVLEELGVDANELEQPDVLAPFSNDRVRSRPFSCHAHGALITGNEVIPVAPGILVVDEALCFMQAATWMHELELIEYGYELCGAYTVHPGGGYQEHAPMTSREELLDRIAQLPGASGAKRARQALRMVRNGSRSPMETATAMMISFDRRLGGLGCRAFAMNHRITVPDALKTTTAIGYIEVDIYSERHKAGVEYDGHEHGEDERRAHDADRLSVLGSLRVRVVTLTNVHFSSQLKLHRALNAIAWLFGLRKIESAEFQRAQNELRLFVTRHWRSERQG